MLMDSYFTYQKAFPNHCGQAAMAICSQWVSAGRKKGMLKAKRTE